MAIGKIESDKIHFKIGSLEWLNYFGFPMGMILFSFVDLIFVFKTHNEEKQTVFIIGVFVLWGLAITTFVFQLRKLRFQDFTTTKDSKENRANVRQLLKDENWRIDIDNQKLIQATYFDNWFNSSLLSIKLDKDKIQWNIIYHPGNNNSIGAVFSPNRKAHKTIKKIQTIV